LGFDGPGSPSESDRIGAGRFFGLEVVAAVVAGAGRFAGLDDGVAVGVGVAVGADFFFGFGCGLGGAGLSESENVAGRGARSFLGLLIFPSVAIRSSPFFAMHLIFDMAQRKHADANPTCL
jgi:hypothetical protein